MPTLLIDEEPSDEPSAAVTTAKEILRARRRFHQDCLEFHQRTRNQIWFNSSALPADVLAALGNRAKGVFKDMQFLEKFFLDSGGVSLSADEQGPAQPVDLRANGTVILL